MKVKTAELIDAGLDWAVATAAQRNVEWDGIGHWVDDELGCKPIGPGWKQGGKPCGYSPSTLWADGGPIIDREWINTFLVDDSEPVIWRAEKADPFGALRRNGISRQSHIGPTPLIAAMRCFVASRMGDEIDVPEELMK